MMNSVDKLDAIEKLIGYSGLERAKAKDYLERCHWNVQNAYTMYKKTKMASSGFIPPTPMSSNTYSTAGITQRYPVPGTTPVTMVTHGPPVGFARPTSYRMMPQGEGLGTVVTGMGPAVGDTHPAFLQQQYVPKFPVEKASERIIPIQIENQSQVSNRPSISMVTRPNRPSPPPYQAPVNPARTAGGIRVDALPKSQSCPVPTRNDPVWDPKDAYNDSYTPAAKTGFMNTDRILTESGNRTSQNLVRVDDVKPAQSLVRAEDVKPLDNGCLNTPKIAAGSTSPKILKRGISKISENSFLVDQERQNVLHDIVEDCHDNMYVQTFLLPDISGYSDDFRDFLEKDLIELSTLVSLEQAGRLNWWAELGVCQRLMPMATSGDGNCLLHAASLAMWGIHDRQLMLRKALYDTLTKKFYSNALYRRWRLQQTQTHKQAGLIFTEAEWKTEWDNVLRLASTTPRTLPGSAPRSNSCCDSMLTQQNSSSTMPEANSDSPIVYESLEEFHVFVLAHVIQRPIIVVADTILRDASGEAMAPIPFGGIYLPLECEAAHCYRSPLLLTYDAAHFSALVPMESQRSEEDKNSALPVAIPIVSSELKILPLHFAIDPGSFYNWEKNQGEFMMPEEQKINILKRYMDLERLPISGSLLDSGSDKNSTGSYESDDGLTEKGKKEKKRGNSVSKQFGSFGKSVGKKLKNLGKGGSGKDEKKSSRNSSSQNSKIPLTISALAENEQQSLWCCRLVTQKSVTHQKMIDNYLCDASERFKADLAGNKIKHKESSSNVGHRVQCVTQGCSLFGTVETSYLCSKCYADQKKVIIDQEKDRLKEFEHNKHHKHKDEVDGTKIGKSKFYDMKNGEVQTSEVSAKSTQSIQPPVAVNIGSQSKVPVPNSQQKGPVPSSLSKIPISTPGVPQARPLTRTPSPDYDNVEYKSAGTVKPSVSMVPSHSVSNYGAQRCMNEDCAFYGNDKYDGFCSSCFKEKQKLQKLV
ncbi:OTU domain-containing protein 7B-like isoform X1 [Dreissena polymorpha]|nr:OTU domain-containing protein 7B-like isoform X1 [Dreissena polymorpha]